jgi:hypothetical protein
MLPYKNPGPYTPEELRTENDILKMKLMLEYGASFESMHESEEIDPEITFQFLNHVLEYEKNADSSKLVSVGEILGDHEFVSVNELKDGEVEDAIKFFQQKLNEKGIAISVLSPNVSPREFYRFLTEELLEVEMYDHFSPGMYCFIYDEFHPDPYYENENTAVDYCIRHLLRKQEWITLFDAAARISLNQYKDLSLQQFTDTVRKFRDRYREINCLSAEATKTTIRDQQCIVEGYQETGLCTEFQCHILKGFWEVSFSLAEDGLWQVTSIKLEGIDF